MDTPVVIEICKPEELMIDTSKPKEKKVKESKVVTTPLEFDSDEDETDFYDALESM
jgi:hypothetical protein